jgi:hypothetical protein
VKDDVFEYLHVYILKVNIISERQIHTILEETYANQNKCSIAVYDHEEEDILVDLMNVGLSRHCNIKRQKTKKSTEDGCLLVCCFVVEVYRCFKGACCLYHQGDESSTRLRGATTQMTAIFKLAAVRT